ncbi:hypothetical protein EVAR_6453_1 [Eumeta japonica]|uniref:Uncharacterized protein n=1 Tax=Eumeta variegata TaxID=151549 RepID=A0A4C1SQK0_EUMVA|nr:hypothetical protein EVAR_6453_1 [Eumeta japonica]
MAPPYYTFIESRTGSLSGRPSADHKRRCNKAAGATFCSADHVGGPHGGRGHRSLTIVVQSRQIAAPITARPGIDLKK